MSADFDQRNELCELRLRYLQAVMRVTPEERRREIRQLVVDWMDMVEQTDEEALPIRLLELIDAEGVS